MAKRTETKVAVLVQVMAELGIDRETIGKVTGVPQRTVGDIVNRHGYWGYTAEFNELRESYRIYLRKFILDDAMALADLVFKRFEEIIKAADFMTAITIANAVTNLATKFDDRR